MIYFYYFLQFIKARLVYRGDFLASLVSNVIFTASGILFVVFLVDGQIVSNLKGWSRYEVLFIYGYSMISMAIFGTLAPNLYGFGDRYVIQGQFDRVLLRPLNTLCQVMFESFNLDSLGSFLVGLSVMSYSCTKLELSFGLLDYLWLILSCISGSIILLSVFVVLASSSFHFEDRVGIAPPFYNLIMFGRYPLPVFNGLIQFILRWVVPFGFVAFYPATHFLRRPEFKYFCYSTPIMAIICLVVASAAWNWGSTKYASAGS